MASFRTHHRILDEGEVKMLPNTNVMEILAETIKKSAPAKEKGGVRNIFKRKKKEASFWARVAFDNLVRLTNNVGR